MKSTWKLMRFLKPYWHWALLAPLLMMLEVATDLLQPRLIQRIVDDGIARSDTTLVVSTGLLMIGLAFIGMLGGMGGTVFAVLAAQGFGADLRSTLFGKVQALSFGNLDELVTGKLVTRLTSTGEPFYPEQRMTREEALRAYTINAAYAAFEDQIKGSLTPGKLADITVLSEDILTVPDERILNAEVLYTIVGGELLYTHPEL